MSGFASLRLGICTVLLGVVALASMPAREASAAADQNLTLGPSGLPLPRFVSLKSGRVNSRIRVST